MRKGMIIVVALFLIILSMPVHAATIGHKDIEIGTKVDMCGGWNIQFDHVKKGYTEQVFNISVQNLQDTKRYFNLTQILEPLNYELDKANMELFEWKGILTEVPTYGSVLIEKQCTDNNITYYDCSYYTTVQTGTEEIKVLQWSEAKAQALKETTAHELKENMQLINIPKLGSEYDDGAVDGTKFFQVRIKTPIVKTEGSWGSSGLYSIEADGCIYYDATHSSWWNDTRDYRRPIQINTTENLSDYQVFINITNTTNMLSDKADVAFTYSNGTGIPYWIEENESGYLMAWVKYTGTTANETIYMYYGNTTAVTTESNLTEAFWWADTAETGLYSDTWTLLICGSGGSAEYIANHSKRGNKNLDVNIGGGANNYAWVYRDVSGTVGSSVINASYVYDWYDNNVGSENNMMELNGQIRTAQSATGTIVRIGIHDSVDANYYIYYDIAGAAWVNTTVPVSTGFHKVEVQVFNTNYTMWIDGAYCGTFIYSATEPKYIYFGGGGGGISNSYGHYDDIRVRKNMGIEPIYSIGAEEKYYIPPTITITAPTNITYPTATIPLNVTVSDDSASFSCNISDDSSFLVELTTNTTHTDTLTKGVGSHNISVDCEDSDGATSTEIVYYLVNAQPTASNLTSDPIIVRYAQNTTFNCSGTDPDGDNLTAYYQIYDNDTGTYLLNWTTINYHTFAYADAQHIAIISCKVDDGYINSTQYNISKYIHQILNVTAWDINNNSISNFTATVNGTSQNTTRGYSEFAVENSSYYIEIDAPGYEIKNDTVTINATHTYHNFSLYTENSISFTFKDEETGIIIDDRNISIELISDAFSANYSTGNGTLYLDLLGPTEYTIRYEADGYTERFYYFNLQNRSHTDLTLYLINESSSTDVTATVYDQNNNLLEDVYIKVLRYDLDTNSYLVQEIVKTNFEGVGVLHLVLNDEFYRFILEYEGSVVDETTPSYVYATSLTFQVLLGSTYGELFYNMNDVNYYLTFNKDTNNFRYTFSDENNIVSAGCLKVWRVSLMGDTYIETSCVNSSTGTILVGVTNTSGATYKASGYVYFSDDESFTP